MKKLVIEFEECETGTDREGNPIIVCFRTPYISQDLEERNGLALDEETKMMGRYARILEEVDKIITEMYG